MSRIEILRRLEENERDLQMWGDCLGIQGNRINIQQRTKYEPCGEDCSICLEKIENDGYKTSCNHHFHENCLNTWKNMDKRSCPNCRSKL